MEPIKKFYVYKITNTINGKIYIGKATNINKRWNKHKATARAKRPKDYSYIHKAMNKYGFDNFIIEILSEYNSEAEALTAETDYIKQYGSRDRNVGYNLTNGGEGISGFKFSKESKKQMSENRRGKYTGAAHSLYGKVKTTSCRGEKVSSAKLTENQVIDLLNDRKSGMTWKVLGIKYGISLKSAWQIGTGKNWKHIPR
jgi:group I intron endonuclease